MFFARDSSNGGFVGMMLHMSCSLSNLLFYIVQMVVPSGLCNEAGVDFVVCCVTCSDLLVGCINLGLLVLWRR